MTPDPTNPNVRQAAAVISELIWRFVTTHSPAECAELERRVAADRAARDRLFGTPEPTSYPRASGE